MLLFEQTRLWLHHGLSDAGATREWSGDPQVLTIWSLYDTGMSRERNRDVTRATCDESTNKEGDTFTTVPKDLGSVLPGKSAYFAVC
jgi:hypothetical protein